MEPCELYTRANIRSIECEGSEGLTARHSADSLSTGANCQRRNLFNRADTVTNHLTNVFSTPG